MEEIEEMEDPVDTRFFHQVAAVYSDVIQRGEASIQNGKSPADTLRDMIMPLLERCQEISVAFKENHGNRAALNSLWNQSRPYRVVIETILRSALTIIPVDMAEQMILVTRNDYYPGTLPNI